MRSLLEIGADLDALDTLLSEVDLSIQRAEGEITPEISAALESLDGLKKDLGDEFDTKIDNFAAYIRTLKLRAEAREEEKKRLSTRIRVDENNAKFLSEFLKAELVARNIKKVETRRFKIGVAGNGGLQPLAIDQHYKDVPADAGEFAETVVTHRLKTDVLRKALEAGAGPAWARLEDRGSHLSIR